VDSSFGTGKPFAFRLGKGKVIRGWEGIVPGMTPGMRVVVRVPPEYAYGPDGKGKVPPNAALVFYMELISLGDIKEVKS
jgi:FKBP-type peptidyl-prolyl cis-trans isomerase FkpA